MGMEKPPKGKRAERFLADVRPYWSTEQLPKWFLMVAIRSGWVETRRGSVRLTPKGLELRNRMMRERAESKEREQ
jgi:hypothetical protein